MSDRSLGIEVTHSWIKVVEINASTNPPRVYNFVSAKIFSSHSENISQQLHAVLSDMGRKTKKARIAIEDSAACHVTSLPPIPKKEMGVVVGRELKGILGDQDLEMVLGWKVLGDAEAGKKTVLVSGAPSVSVKEKASLLRDIGLSPDVITTTPLGLFSALKLIQGLDQGASALVHVGEARAYAIFIKEGKWAFFRELGGSTVSSEGLLNEMNRSILYFRQQYRGKEVGRVFLSGEVSEELEKTWSDTLGIGVELFYPDLDLTPLEGRGEAFRRILHEFAIPIGLAGKRAIEHINLPEPEGARRTRKKGMQMAAILGLVISALVMGVSYGTVSRNISHDQWALIERRQALKALGPYLGAYDERMAYKKNLAFLKEVDDHTLWAEGLKEISVLVPPEMSFQSLSLKRENEKTALIIKGEVVAPQTLSGQEVFSRFYSRLESSPLFTNVSVEPTSIKVIRPKGNNEISTVTLRFEVKGELGTVEIEYEGN